MRTASAAFASASVIAIAASFICAPAFAAQTTAAAAATPADNNNLTEIVVTARRTNESLQNVPVSMQVVTGADVQKLAITQATEISKLAPGLTLRLDTPSEAVVTLRSVRWTPGSGTPAIPIYLNEIAFDPANVLQTVFDVGQIEVLRGPQGTARGAPSISGAVTITSTRPTMNEFGGYGAVQAGSGGHENVQGALNIPLITDKLAVRVAGNLDQSEGNRVHSLNNGIDPSVKTLNGRVSVRFEPTDTLQFNAMYQHMDQKFRLFTQVAGPGSAGVPALGIPPNFNSPPIAVDEYLAVQDAESRAHTKTDLVTMNSVWDVLGQQLSYNFGYQRSGGSGSGSTIDPANDLVGYDNLSTTGGAPTNSWFNEVRLSSKRGLGRFFDYDIGYYSQQTKGTINADGPAALLPGALNNPFNGSLPSPFVNPLAIDRYSLQANTDITLATRNYSFYGNLNLHLPYDIELSGGLRWIHDQRPTTLVIQTTPGFAAAFQNPLAGRLPCSALAPGLGLQNSPIYAGACDFPVAARTLPVEHFANTYTPTIYNVSLSKKFTPDLLAYATVGTSWRAGLPAIANDGLPANLLVPDPEKAKSYEVGMKSTWGWFRINADIFQIDYKGQLTQFRGVPYYNSVGQTINQTSLAFFYNVDARVRGVEAEIDAQPIHNLSLSTNFSYSQIESKGGNVPCNDPSRPITPTNPINLCPSQKGQILNASAPFQASLNGSYDIPMDNFDGYLRFVVNYQGHNPNYGASDFGIKAYTIVDLFAGLTGGKGAWDLGVYAKNVFNKQTVLTSRQILGPFGLDQTFGPTGLSAVNATLKREVGVQLRYAFGSR